MSGEAAGSAGFRASALHRRAIVRHVARRTAAARPGGAPPGAGEPGVAAPVELATGVRIACRTQGDPDGVPVVLLHGLPLSSRSFEPLLAALPASVRAIVPDQRGHGAAEKPGEGYGLGDFAADLAALLDRLGIARAVVAGHSMGSLVAQRFAVDHPERMLGLVLVSSGLSGQDDPETLDPELAGLVAAIAALTDPVDPEFVRAYWRLWLPEADRPAELPPGLVEALDHESLAVPAGAWREVWRGLLEDDFAAELAAVEVPALTIWGERDPLCSRADQDALIATLADARLETHPDAGHVPFWDDPRWVAGRLSEFARSVASTTTKATNEGS